MCEGCDEVSCDESAEDGKRESDRMMAKFSDAVAWLKAQSEADANTVRDTHLSADNTHVEHPLRSVLIHWAVSGVHRGC